MLQSIHHVTICSRDFALTEQFYDSLLGLRNGFRPPFEQAGLWLYLADKAVIHVVADAAERPVGSIDHFAFDGRDLQGFADRLRQGGHAYRLKRLPDGTDWQLFTRDPDGTLIEIVFPANEVFQEDSL